MPKRILYGPVRMDADLWKLTPGQLADLGFTGILAIVADRSHLSRDLKRLRALVGDKFEIAVEMPTGGQPPFDDGQAWHDRMQGYIPVVAAMQAVHSHELVLNVEDEKENQGSGMAIKQNRAKVWHGSALLAAQRYRELAVFLRGLLPGIVLAQDVYSFRLEEATDCYKDAIRAFLDGGGNSYQADGIGMFPQHIGKTTKPVTEVGIVSFDPSRFWVMRVDGTPNLKQASDTRRADFAAHLKRYAGTGAVAVMPDNCGNDFHLPWAKPVLPLLSAALAEAAR